VGCEFGDGVALLVEAGVCLVLGVGFGVEVV